MNEQRPFRAPGLLTVLLCVAAVVSASLATYQVFNLGGRYFQPLLSTQYYYLLLATVLPLVFIAFDLRGRKREGAARIPWYDGLLALATAGVLIFFFANSERALREGWEYLAPEHVVYLSYLLWGLCLEATRRAGGWPVFLLVLAASLFPVWAHRLPDAMAAASTPVDLVAIFHANSTESLLGIPLQAFANLVFGFLIFGVALQKTGGGRFFINLAFALLGHVRGGPAKVAIFSSGLMGSMSGSVVTNVLTTGSLTIPAMRRVGFSPRYAGGVETCASTGGVLMPPVMGATAFVMATFLEVPYSHIVMAAILPSALYFFGLFVQLDYYAARTGLKGLPKEQLPTLTRTFADGWHYLAVFVLLVWMLLVLQREAQAPYYATALLLVVNQIRSVSRWSWRDCVEFLRACGALFAELAGIMAGIGLIMGGLAVSGMASTLANDLLHLAGGDVRVLILMGAVTSFVLGIGMTTTAAYIFLAIALAPALVTVGLNPLGVHLFILYWAMLSFITPPVALGAFAAASVAGARPMPTALESMRLGSIIYFIPFFFIMEPALILEGTVPEVLVALAFAISGIFVVAAGLQGYLPFAGPLTATPAWSAWPVRGFLLGGGLLLALPHSPLLGVSSTTLSVWAVVLTSAGVAGGVCLNRCRPGERLAAGSLTR
ncbi:MAG: TRAP transporter fused permease subunit [Ectothiorhodospiraceae bacterium]|nr:TRAP transporter fused permease subunit [Ectothiorhodospiraceae bacterium]